MVAIVMTSSAHMPNSCKGRYINVAVVDVVSAADRPKMISDRARGVIKIVRHFGPQSVGSTERCASRRALREALALLRRPKSNQRWLLLARRRPGGLRARRPGNALL